jgi:hypothetical protein
MAVRHDDVNGQQTVRTSTSRDEAAAHFEAMFDGLEDVTLVTRLNTDWYSFAEYLIKMRNGGVRRLALTHPAENGLFTGTFGYGRDEKGQ